MPPAHSQNSARIVLESCLWMTERGTSRSTLVNYSDIPAEWLGLVSRLHNGLSIARS